MLFVHVSPIDEAATPSRAVTAEVRPAEAARRLAPAWNGFVLAQSSAGPASDLGSSSGPASGSINPYTATPGSIAPVRSPAPGSAAPSTAGINEGFGTQQDQSGSARVAPSEAASPNLGKGPKTVPVPVLGTGGAPGTGITGSRPIEGTDVPDVTTSGPGPAGLDKGTSAYSNAGPGSGLMDTGRSVTAPPPPSLTDTDRGQGGSGSKPGPASRTSETPSSSSTPTPPPPSPTDTGSSSTR